MLKDTVFEVCSLSSYHNLSAQQKVQRQVIVVISVRFRGRRKNAHKKKTIRHTLISAPLHNESEGG